MTTINIDVRQIREIADKGIRRTVVFLGLGLNAAHREDFVDYELSKLPKDAPGLDLHIVPSNASAEVVSKFKNEFALWLIGCGLRELTENFALFLDSIHYHGLLVEHIKGKDKFGDPKTLQSAFHKKGVRKKLDTLVKRFTVKPKFPEYLNTIAVARNCLVHRLGVVGEVDCGHNDMLDVRWRAFDIWVELEESKQRIDISDVIGMSLPEPGHVKLQYVERVASFKEGQVLRLSHDNLWEICLFLGFCVSEIIETFLGYMNTMGVPLVKDDGVLA